MDDVDVAAAARAEGGGADGPRAGRVGQVDVAAVGGAPGFLELAASP